VPELKRAKETLTRRLGAQQAAVHQREAQFASLQAQRDAMGLPKIDAETLASTEETDSEGGDMHALRDAWTAVTASRAACRKTEKQLASVDERLQHSTHSPWELYCMVRDLTQEVQHLQEELRDLRDRDRDRSVPHTCVQCSVRLLWVMGVLCLLSTLCFDLSAAAARAWAFEPRGKRHHRTKLVSHFI
jgi:hypothetical protein